MLGNSKKLAVEIAVVTGLFLFGYLLTINAYAVGKFAEAGYPHYGPSHSVWFVWTLLGRVGLGLIVLLMVAAILVAPVVCLLGVAGKTFR